MHKKLYLYCLGILISMGANGASATTLIEQLVSPAAINNHLGVYALSLKDGKAIYELNSKQAFTPASTVKVLTAVAALKYLGGDFKFSTDLYMPKASKGVVSGMYIRFSGDPTLTIKDLEKMVNGIKKSGVRHINGNILVDDSLYDGALSGPGWMVEDQKFCYQVPISALILDENCLDVVLKPHTISGRAAHFESLESHSYVPINNQVKTAPKKTGCKIDANYKDGKYELTGCIAQNANAFGAELAVRDVSKYFEVVFGDILEKAGIKWNGHVILDNALPQSYKLVQQHQSKQLNKLLKECLKESNNLIAEAIFKQLGARYYKTTATWKNSAKALKKIILDMTDLKGHEFKIVDGSGLSRYNLISPYAMGQILKAGWKDKKIKKHLFKMLPKSGVDGTLDERMEEKALRGKVYAKTGSMSGVSALAGYTKGTNPAVFVIISNGVTGKLSPLRRLEDGICYILVNGKSPKS